MRVPRSQQKALAKKRVEILLAKALDIANEDIELAQQQAEIAWRICLRYNIRIPSQDRRLFCRGCGRLIVPGINARLRLGYRPKALKITCLECGHVYRKMLSPKKTPVSADTVGRTHKPK